MSNPLKNTAQEFKNLADNLTVDVATDELWAAIETALPPAKKKKKIILFWWVGMVATVVLIATIGYTTNLFDTYFTNQKNDALLAKTTINETQQTTDKNQTRYNNQQIITKNQNAPLVQNTPKTNENKNETLHNYTNSTLYTNPKTTVNNRRNTPDFITPNNAPTVVKEEPLLVLPITTTGSHETITKKRIPSLLAANISILTIESLPLKTINPDVNKRLITPASKKINWCIQFASGINKNWSQNTLIDVDAETDQRFAKETGVYGVTSDVMVGLRKKKWSFALGVSHSIQASRYTQLETITTQQNVTGVIQSKIADNGLITNLQGQVIETNIQHYDIDWHRVHNELDIQVEIGRTFYRKGRFSMNAYAGIGYNVWSKHSGYYFSAGENTITKMKNNTISPYKNKTGIKYNGAVSLNYDWGRMNIGLSPFVKYSNTSVLKNSAFYTLKNSQYGLQVRMTIRP